MTPVQIPFDIPVRESLYAEDYLVTASNAVAVNWIDQWPDWLSSHCCILHGAAGCGKTHLSHVWQHKSRAARLELEDFDGADYRQVPDCIIIENLNMLGADPAAQEKLFHIYNWQKERGGFLLLTSRRPPKYWGLTLPDLRSRMMASMAIEIGLPDDDLLAAVIVKQFMDRQIEVPKDVISYLLLRIERSFAAARDIVARVDELALSRKRKITVPLVRDLLDQEDHASNII